MFVINSLVGGGAERVMARILCNAADHAGAHPLHLVLLDIEPPAYEVPGFVTVHQLDTGGSTLKGILGLYRLLSKLRPRACLSFLTRSNMIAVIVCRLLSIRCVISERVHSTSHHGNSIPGRAAKILTRLLYPRADAVIAVSDGIADDLSDNYGVDRDKIITIPNPIDEVSTRQMAAAPTELSVTRPLIVAMGRLVPNKNFSMLIEAFAKSQIKGTLIIMGEGPKRAALTAQIDALSGKGRVQLPGFLANPFAIVASADCYVLPSNGEGFPNGLIEAMILGRPVIATNCHSGPSEILADRPYFEINAVHEAPYGVLVPTNDPGAMAEALQKVLAPGEFGDRSTRALKGAQRYQLGPTVARYFQVLDPERHIEAASPALRQVN
ncbi:glycosyltransferase [Pelagibacterium luteolum]|uniref:glycosyltransferase n=1 Tax=Pelagibacterium luteolum TaxID=440168 RepID=UPI000B84BD7F|nr:glycosyltransferase [Pelagibacterium luteolum]